ncbi:choline ABC transporter substrate-binding protein [Ectopseudomonas oleovorans]|uniref:Choline ABC transporter substrate-binding protein n=1 Tax=Ectopseudomonas oleovorans TaxID=301 RepID=A0AA42Q9E6_ECTOL|nr:choline ABC transporter substrate-binding protein [Pseudomonas oleovorans]MDH1339624.1 choline ABC transporter substrate-binding protein [Pseudomonas oleovorans]MDH1492504.1 choline ABC transporter substrate-binding protein [Pseudomonas oleovorans]WGG21500.1 choline ABC transporter substrate-binding protein [Pseudomonas oleovorans]
MKGLTALAACCTLSLFTTSILAAEEASCREARIGVVGWTDVVATTAVAATLLENLGYKTRQTTASQQIIFSGIDKRQIDFFLGYWKPAMDANIQPFLDKGQVRVFAEPSLADAIATLAVPGYLADQGLRSFSDIARFKEQLGGKIHGIEPGTGANANIQKMIDSNQFGLGGFRLVESSEAAMLAAVGRANKRGDAIVFVGWKPHPMNIQMKLTYLTGSEDVFGPNEGAASVSTVTAPDYAARCPNVHRLLSNLKFTAEQESQLMEPIMAREDAKAVARKWLKENPDEVRRFLAGVTTFDGRAGVDSVLAALD